MRAILAISLASSVTCGLSAQAANLIGFTAGMDISYTSRVATGSIEADCLQHFSGRDYRNWILNPADNTGNTMRFVGLRIQLQDQNAATNETYTLVGYREDPLNPNFPDVSGLVSGPVNPGGKWFRTSSIPFPAGSGGATILFGINPPAVPLFHNPNLDDVFLGVGFNPGNWPTDGLGVIIAHEQQATIPANPPRLDDTGPRVADITSTTSPNFCCQVATALGVPTGAPATFPAGALGQTFQLSMDVLALATGGVSVTQTNQTNYPSSTVFVGGTVPQGGTTNVLSGLHPDMNNFNASTPPRADDIGFLINERNRPNSLCAVIIGFGPPSFGINPDGSFPLAAFFSDPDTRGLLCVDPGSPSTLFIGGLNGAGTYQQMFPMSPALRATVASLQPFDVIWQGFVIDGTLTEVKATGCVTQHL